MGRRRRRHGGDSSDTHGRDRSCKTKPARRPTGVAVPGGARAGQRRPVGDALGARNLANSMARRLASTVNQRGQEDGTMFTLTVAEGTLMGLGILAALIVLVVGALRAFPRA